MLSIRDAIATDASAIIRFWNPLIRDTAVTFSSQQKSVADVTEMISARQAAQRCFIVAELDGNVVGFATYDQFRAGNGYSQTMEHTVIVTEHARGAGVARALMTALEDHARKAGVTSIIAGISSENQDGLRFHAAMGYLQVGVVARAGRKFGRWMDLHLLQKLL